MRFPEVELSAGKLSDNTPFPVMDHPRIFKRDPLFGSEIIEQQKART